jgi:hypothetical protein
MNKWGHRPVYGFGELLPPTVPARSAGNEDVARFAIRGLASPTVCLESRLTIITSGLYYKI